MMSTSRNHSFIYFFCPFQRTGLAALQKKYKRTMTTVTVINTTSQPSPDGVDEEQPPNQNATSIPLAPTIVIALVSLMRIGAGCSAIVSAVNLYKYVIGGDIFIPCFLLSEILEFAYYMFFGNRERDIGPRGGSAMNALVFFSFIGALVLLIFVGIANFEFKLWPMLLWVGAGNATETIKLFFHRVNGQLNWILATSKSLVTLANLLFIFIGDFEYEKAIEFALVALTITFGVLYIVHGITLYFGMRKYYYYPINA